MRNTSPTKSAELQLKEELQVIHQGYEFLDEKRILLAAELLKQLEDFKKLQKAYKEKMALATTALRQAVHRHGIDGLQVYPAAPLSPEKPESQSYRFLGITLSKDDLHPIQTEPEFTPVDPSHEAGHCRDVFRDLIGLGVRLASISGNLSRLSSEYKRTEQRARALENVLLPEIRTEIKWIEDQLEIMGQEEIIRVRLVGNDSNS